jgi:hypothetical protein
MNKVYKKGDELIVCFKGGHYIAPASTRVTGKTRVPVVVGEASDTVLVAGEVWTLKATYAGAKKKKKGSVKRTHLVARPVKKTAIPRTLEPCESALRRIGVVAPNPSAESLMRVMYANWLRGCYRLQLFQGLNYKDADVTAAVRGLGIEIMDEFRAKDGG